MKLKNSAFDPKSEKINNSTKQSKRDFKLGYSEDVGIENHKLKYLCVCLSW